MTSLTTTKKAIAIRCSRLVAIVKCGQAAFPPSVAIEEDADASRMGTAIHDAMSARIDERDRRDLLVLARIYNVDSAELDRAIGWTWAAWMKYRAHFPAPETEVAMEFMDDRHDILLTGTADVLSAAPGDPYRLNIYDHKTGWADGDAEAQVKGYAFLGMQGSDFLEARAFVPRPRLGIIDVYPTDKEAWSRAELEEWWDGLASRVRDYPAFSTGPQCRCCPRWLECNAAKAEIAAARSWLIASSPELVEEQIGAMSAEQLMKLHWTQKSLERALEVVDRAKRNIVAKRGSVEADGWELHLKQEERRPVDMRKALPILTDVFADRLGECVSLTKEKAKKIIGGRAWRDVERRLALRVEIVEKLECRRSGV